MFRPTHKSVVETSVDTLPVLKPVRKRGNSDSEVQAPNHKSETIGSGFTRTKPYIRPSKLTKYIR